MPKLLVFYMSKEDEDEFLDYVRSLGNLLILQIMLPGGMQADMNYIDSERQDLDLKPAEFRRWFESVDGWVRKNYRRLGIYVFAGPGAQRFREQGGILQGR